MIVNATEHRISAPEGALSGAIRLIYD